MAVYLIGYDLRTGQDYSRLTSALRSFPSWWHHLDSTWIVQSDASAAAIRDWLWGFMYPNDKLLVMQHTPTVDAAAWQGMPQDGSEWLKAVL